MRIVSETIVSKFYRPELDALRFLAFMAVFFHHCAPYRVAMPSAVWQRLFTVRYALGGGLCLFFLLSSYLITELLLRERANTNTIWLHGFYVRRGLRIWPLYALFLCFAYVFGRLEPFAPFQGSYLLRYLLLAGNWAYYAHPTNNPAGPLWSISVEEQFYLCWPILAKRFGRKGLVIAAVSFIPVALAACIVFSVEAKAPGLAIWTASSTQFECFGLGALLAVILHGKRWKIRLSSRLGLLASGLALWFYSEGFTHFQMLQNVPDRLKSTQIIGFQSIVAGCGLVFLAALGSPVPRMFSVLVYFGKISYGLYVFHMLSFYIALRLFAFAGYKQRGFATWSSFGVMSCALLITVVLAATSYEFLEMPFLKLKKRFSVVSSREA